METLRQESTDGVPTFVAGRQVSELVTLSLAMLSEASRRLMPFNECGAHAALGFTSPVRHLEATTGCSAAHGEQLVRVTRFCARHERTADALHRGEINIDQVDLLARYAHDLPDPYTQHETDLLRACVDRPTEELTRLLRLWRSRVSEATAAEILRSPLSSSDQAAPVATEQDDYRRGVLVQKPQRWPGAM